MKVFVEVWGSDVMMRAAYQNKHSAGLIRAYVVDHNSVQQRRVLGEQIANAFETGQCVVSWRLRE